MTALEDQAAATGLLLAGYVALCEAGFALPCYATGRQANAWNVAACSLNGDHTGKVVGFEVFEGEGVVILPEDLRCRVLIGECWQDVFLWEGRAFIGTPQSLFEGFRPEIDRLIGRIPISTLELALAANAPNIRAFVKAAIWHVERRHGEATAARWRRDVLLKGEVRLALRRLLAAAGADRDIVAGARPAIAERANGYNATLPTQTSSFLAAAGLLEDARHAARNAAHTIGADLHLDFSLAKAPTLMAREPLATNAYWSGDAARLLVAAIGSRATTIARHISAPDWIPTPHAPDILRRWTVRRGRESNGNRLEASVVDVADGTHFFSSSKPYSSVVWLIDDTSLSDSGATEIIRAIANRHTFDHQTVHLLAPALPILTTSRFF